MHKVDQNDLKFVIESGYRVLGWVPTFIGENDLYVNRTCFWLGKNKYITISHIKPVYYETMSGYWRPLSEVCTHHGNRDIRLSPKALHLMSPRFLNWLIKRQQLLGKELVFDYGFMGAGVQPKHLQFATTTTFYPDPHTETTTVDGNVLYNSDPSTWATMIGAASGNSAISDSTGNGGEDTMAGFFASTTSNRWRINYRGFFLFNTASIGSDTVDSGTFSGKQVASSNTDNYSQSVALVASAPASNTDLVTGDYDSLGSTRFCDTDIGMGGMSTNTYQNFALNSSGLTAVSTSGVTKLGTRASGDLNNTEPTWTSNGRSFVNWVNAESSGTTSDPKLAIVHTAPAGTFIPKVAFF